MHALTDAFALPFFRTALIISLVLAGIHAYLGFHIVRRGVLFVDLALAQMAALGVAVALAMDLEHHPVASYMLALGMTFVGATLFAWLRGRSRARGIPLEAFIGIVFATAQAAVFLILEKSPSGPEHLKETLVGSLFTVDPKHVLRVTILFAAVGIIHVLVRKPFFEITNDPQGAEARGRKIFLWDLFFYATFGVVVTSAVQMAGVLLVFGLLVIPAVAGLLATRRPGVAMTIGWVFGFLACAIGLVGSVSLDMPAAPSILVTLTILLLIVGAVAGILRPAVRANRRA